MGSTFEDFKASSVAVKKDLDLDNLKDILFSVFETTQKKETNPVTPSKPPQSTHVEEGKGWKPQDELGCAFIFIFVFSYFIYFHVPFQFSFHLHRSVQIDIFYASFCDTF
jgi:hypothetical protein